jgi:hypothetical protein
VKLDELQREMRQYARKRFSVALDEWAAFYPKDSPADSKPRLPEGIKTPNDPCW